MNAACCHEQNGVVHQSIGAIGACLVYGFLCRIIPGRWLIHLAIASGVLSTLAYLLVEGE